MSLLDFLTLCQKKLECVRLRHDLLLFTHLTPSRTLHSSCKAGRVSLVFTMCPDDQAQFLSPGPSVLAYKVSGHLVFLALAAGVDI